MSNKAVAWAFEVEGLTAAQKFLLVALADFADESNSCYPGQETLAKRVSSTRETVSRNLAKLEDMGAISRERRHSAAGYRTSDRFVVNVGWTPGLCDANSREPSSRDPNSRDSDTGAYVTQDHNLCDANRGAVEPSVNHQRTTRGVRARRSPERPLPDDWQPNQTAADFAEANGLDLAHEASQFVNHAKANDRRARDWNAAFRMWLGKSAQWSKERSKQLVTSKKSIVQLGALDRLGHADEVIANEQERDRASGALRELF